MARTKKPDIKISPECEAAYLRLVALAHRLSSLLTGDPLASDGIPDTLRSQALARGMMFFLLKAGPDDLHAMFFAEKSFNQFNYKPVPPDFTCKPIFGDRMLEALGGRFPLLDGEGDPI